MRQIPKKNYYILVVLLVVTILLTLSLSYVYRNKEKLVSNFYEYSNKIKPQEFDEYMIENSDFIIYISDKYDLTYEEFENKFKEKLEKLNLKSNLIYIDKNDINKEFLNKLKKEYNINIEIKDTPIVIVVVDNKVIKNVSVDIDSDVDTLIEYEVFE